MYSQAVDCFSSVSVCLVSAFYAGVLMDVFEYRSHLGWVTVEGLGSFFRLDISLALQLGCTLVLSNRPV